MSLNSLTAPFPSASGKLRRYRNLSLVIIINYYCYYSQKRIAYKLRGSPAWKHTITEDIQAPWESSMETDIHTRGYSSSACGSPALTQ